MSSFPFTTRRVVIIHRSKFFLLLGVEKIEQAMLIEGRVEKEECFRGKLTKALGLEACGELSFSRASGSTPWFPFTGPARATLTLNKKDTFTKYEFEAKYIKTKDVVNGEKEIIDTARVSFNTPDSRINREITTDFKLNRMQKTVSLEMSTPWKQASVSGKSCLLYLSFILSAILTILHDTGQWNTCCHCSCFFHRCHH